METKKIPIKKDFIGRQDEMAKAHGLNHGILIVYGRRRIGKTELLEQSFRHRQLLKFEGIENKKQPEQMRHVTNELARYAKEPLLEKTKPASWLDVFDMIHHYTKEGEWTLYFEELQWLADYQDDFISELKYAWDNYFRYNKKIIIILCGSAPSFMINHVAHSKALYNRSTHEIALGEFSLPEARKCLAQYAIRDVMDAYLTVGGIPLYLNQLKNNRSIFLSLCKESFTKQAFFSQEYDRIFISSMSNNKHYQSIIRYLSSKRFATRKEIANHLKIQSGKNLTEVLIDLEVCGFISKYVPYNAKESSLLSRYCISDPYLQFYNKFIQPIHKQIQDGKFQKNPSSAIKTDSCAKWLGFAFKRFCRRYHYVIADILSFASVNYQSGAFFNRATEAEDKNFQIDLMFDRDDNVLTICEIKYSKNPIKVGVIKSFEEKLDYFHQQQSKTIHKVLIASNGVDKSVIEQGYFDNIITLDNLFDEKYW